MSSDFYIHATRSNIPWYHRHIGGSKLRDELPECLVNANEYHRSPGWTLFHISYTDVLRLLSDMESRYLSDKQIKEVIMEVKHIEEIDEDCNWFIWEEY